MYDPRRLLYGSLVLLVVILALVLVRSMRERGKGNDERRRPVASASPSPVPSSSPSGRAEPTPGDAPLDTRQPARMRRPTCRTSPPRGVVPKAFDWQYDPTRFGGASLVENKDLGALKTFDVRWQNWHFVKTKLRGADLTEAELIGTVLRDVELQGAVMRGVKAHTLRALRVSFAGADLTDADLRCAELFDADFTRAKLAGADLNGADLTRAHGLETVDLSQVDLRLALYSAETRFPKGLDPAKRGAVRVGPKADLSGMWLLDRDLRDLHLEDANMTDMAFGRSDLSGTDLTRADLRGSDLRVADLGKGERCARFQDTILPDGTRWSGCGGDLPAEKRKAPDVVRAARPLPPRSPRKLDPLPCDGPPVGNVDAGAGRRMPIRDLLEAYARGERDFSSVQIDGERSLPERTVLRDANLSFAKWRPEQRIDLSGLDFNGGSLKAAVLGQLRFRGASMKRADLSFILAQIDLTEADLGDADLTCMGPGGSILRRAKLGNAKLRGARLRGAKLLGADLRGADLRGATFDDFTLFPPDFDPIAAGAVYLGVGGDMRGVDLRPHASTLALLDDADLQDANLEGLDLKGFSFKRADLRGANVKGVKWAVDPDGRWDRVNCAKFEDTIMPEGDRYSGVACSVDFPARYKPR